ncbi:hypothetical protein KIW84_035720 [Lathyrus oleraceus]|uniref:Reverse transcriptase n=1 Tax=Pisum sativum TaxID=3888 RepID=A0A9D5B6E5_PEA|nr:hypothetical protein KIW84_035720 [Pisum sativum]
MFFSGLLKKACKDKEFHDIQIARKALIFSHLFFIDDNLLFTHASDTEVFRVISIMRIYQESSGQVVNLDKSEASFTQNMCDDVKELICNRMQVKTLSRHAKYLGLPVIFGRSKKEIFGMVLDRVWKKIKDWKEKVFSSSGKEVLIKVVAQEIPNYIMRDYRLPEGICNEIEGGMGLRGISNFNTSLLGKHFWRLMTSEESLLSKLLKSRYYPRCHVTKSPSSFYPSYTWRSILSVRECVSNGTRWHIGTGAKVRIWKDNWTPCVFGFTPQSPILVLDNEAKVSELIDHDLGC